MRNIVYLHNQVLNYAWGDRHTLHDLYAVPNPDNAPQAELWLGAYLKNSSQVQKGRRLRTLTELIAKNPAGALSENTALKYDNKLSFLFKVLAVEKPLPVQVHPNRKQASISYARENLLEVSLDAPNRNYVDETGKPKMIYALTPFELMCGFREMDEIKTHLAVLIPCFFMEKNLAQADYKSLFNALVQLEAPQKAVLLAKALQSVAKLADQDIARWILSLSQNYPNDIGILMPALLNLVRLAPGEALYIPPRTLHCYLQGAGLELMGNSDNVLRCALTDKHIDLSELNIITRFKNQPPVQIKPDILSALETTFTPPRGGFMLSAINMPVAGQIYHQKRAMPEILLCAKGKFIVSRYNHKTGLILKPGQSMFVSHGVGGYSLHGQGLVYKASLA